MQGIISEIKTFKHYNNPAPTFILRRLIAEKNYDAVHLHGYNGKSRLWFALKMAGKSIPVICSSRDQPKKGFFFRRMFWSHLDKILVPNQLVKDFLIESIGDKKSIRILEPQVDTELLIPLKDKKNTITKIGLFARFDPIKAFPIFFEACRNLIQRNLDIPIKIVIAGTNFQDHKEELENLLKQYNLEDHTQMIGFIPNIGDEIAKLDIGVISSIGSEELSRIGLEYMACGVPVVSTDVGGLPELISEKEGRVVPSHSVEKLTEALEELLKNPELRITLGKQARETAEKVHSIKVHCQALEHIIKESAQTREFK